MNIQTSTDVLIKDEKSENENVLGERLKSNDFHYINMNDFNENNLDGVEIKEEEEQVENFVTGRNEMSTNETDFGGKKSSKLVMHSQSENSLQQSNDTTKRKLKKGQVLKHWETNLESNRYRLRTRALPQKTDDGFVVNSAKKEKTTCVSCGMIFSNKSKLLSHKIEKKKFYCSNCKKYFCSNHLFEQHLETCKTKQKRNGKNIAGTEINNHKISLFKCDKCSRNFIRKQSLVLHISKNKCTSKIYTCAICEKTFSDKSCLKKHIISHIKTPLQCQYCTESFKTYESVNKHNCVRNNLNNFNLYNKSIHQPNKNSKDLYEVEGPNDNQSLKISNLVVHECQTCKKVYKSLVSYKNHLKTHKKDESKCDTTSQTLSTVNLENSNQRFKKKSRYECEYCRKGFTKLVKLKIHILNIHQGVNYQCEKCKKKFPTQDDLDIHLEKQDCQPEDLCTCKTCGKVFAKRDYLKKHQYMHLNALFKCKYCYCAFMKEKSYKRHIEKMNCSKSARKIKMAEYNYKKCRLCEVEYETEELLIKHFREVHVGLEPHQCFCCDSSLSSFQELQNHIHQHNIQKYTCNLCGKPYTSQEGFRKHRLKHKGAEFKCRFCETEFLNESRFKFHEKTCKKNPESGQEPDESKETSKKKDSKPKQSRQLHWESRIIMKRLRGDPKLLTNNQTNCDEQPENAITSAFFDDPESDSDDDRGWFNSYYKTDEDDVTFGLKKTNEMTSQECNSDPDELEFLKTRSNDKKEKNEVQTNSANDQIDDRFDDSSDYYSSGSDEEVDVDLQIEYNPKKCRLCIISFSQEYELLHHFIKAHPGEYAHKCPQCDVQSPLYAQLKEHLKTHGIGIGIFNCDNCSKQFKSEKKMNSHKIRCKGINKANESNQAVFSRSGGDCCRRCGKKFYSKFGYRRHKPLCKKLNKKCTKSEKNNSQVKLEEPVNDNFADDDFQADTKNDEDEEIILKPTDKVIHENDSLVKNEDSKTVELLHDLNKTKFQEEEKKMEIKTTYTGEPPLDSFPCRLCDKKFQYERGIVMHFKSAHPGHKPLICQVCNMHLADKLKEHLKTHGIGEEFICELCGKRFNQKFLSKIHEMWHQGIEYKCNNCKQKFLNKEKMDKHIGENRCSNRQSLMRLPCDICGKSYRSKFGLSKHYITHTPKELRPVKNRMNCEYCGKWFEYNNGLQRHRRIHTGERPYCCRFCPKAFAQEGNCKAHERTHTGESKPRKKKTTAPPSLPTSLPPSLPTSLPTSLPSSLPTSLPPSLPTSLPPSLPPSLPSSLPSSLPPSLPSSLPTSLPPVIPEPTPVVTQFPSLPPTVVSFPAPVTVVQPAVYPAQINLYIYSTIDPSEIVH